MSVECEYLEWHEETRTYSDYVPSYAQGAVFPDDEEGYFCKKCGGLCEAEESGKMSDCSMAKATDIECPNCLLQDDSISMLYHIPEREELCCPVCEYIEDVEIVKKEYKNLIEKYQNIIKKFDKLT